MNLKDECDWREDKDFVRFVQGKTPRLFLTREVNLGAWGWCVYVRVTVERYQLWVSGI